jgi:electron transfer flavoprotein beta subunit
MKIVVLVKVVPDTYGDRTLHPETGLAERGGENVLDEICERALEVALAFADGHPGTEVIAVSMGPESASAGVRKALAMGAASALHVQDDALHGADLGLTAEVLAAAVRRVAPALVIAGNSSTDGVGGVIPAMVAEHLGWAHATGLSSVEMAADAVSGERASDAGAMTVRAALPAVVSITEALPDPRFPNFKGVMAAKKKPVDVVSAADLGVVADDLSRPRAILVSVAKRPARAAGITIVDEGDAGTRLAAFLVENRLA